MIIIPLAYDGVGGSISWTSMPAALTELIGNTRGRIKADLTAFREVRFCGTVITAGTSGASLRVQYSTDQTTWAYLDGSAGPSISLTTGGAILVVSAWLQILADARQDVFLRVVGIDGNGSNSPAFLNLNAQFR